MAKAGELDWGELYKTGKLEQEPIADANVAKLAKMEVKADYHKTGTKPTEEDLRKDANHILDGWVNSPEAQWKDEDHLDTEVVSQEEADQLVKNWEEAINGFYQAANEPITESSDTAAEWTGREPLTKGMSEEELAKWRMYTDR